ADETFQMLAFIMYIQFAATAMDLNKEKQKEKNALLFARMTMYVVPIYILLQIINENVGLGGLAYLIPKILIRIYLLLIGLIMLLIVMRQRQSVYYRYLGGGALSMIIFGLISSLANFYHKDAFMISALTWLMLGFFSDVIFFSSAIGYRI